MRVLVLSGANIDEAHGGSVHTREVAKAFSQLGANVTLVCPGTSQIAGVERIVCSMSFVAKSTTWPALFLEKELRRRQFDLIYERQLFTGGVGAYFGKKWGVPVVYEINSPHRQEILAKYPSLRWVSSLLVALEKRLFSDVACVVTTHRELVPFHFKGKELLGPWGVSFEKEEEISFPFLSTEEKVILVTGSFHSWHGGDRLGPIAQALGRGPWKMVISGHTQRSNAVAYRVRKQAPFAVHSTGELTRGQLFQLMKHSSVLLAPFQKPLLDLPFYYSPFKVLEALACALPVVATDFENVSELLDAPWCGQTVASDDPQVWAAAIKKILHQKRPDEKLGREYEARHSWVAHISHLLKTLEFDI